MTKKLTEQQEAYLDALFGEAYGDEQVAKKMAGYADSTSVTYIRRALQDHIIDRTREALSGSAAKSAMLYGKILDGTADGMLGTKEKLAAAKEVLDRIGVVKTEKVDISASGGLVILPAKHENKD